MEDGKHHSLSRQDGEYIWPRGRTRRSGSPTLLALTVLAGLSWWLFPISYWDIEAKASASPASEIQFSWTQVCDREFASSQANVGSLHRQNRLSTMTASVASSAPGSTYRWTTTGQMAKALGWRSLSLDSRQRFP